MRKTLAFALWAAVAWPSAARGQSTQERLARYFSSQCSVCPGMKVSVTPAPEIGISGYEAFRGVVRDIDLALWLGLSGTPIFFYCGARLSSEPQLAEDYVASRLGGEASASDKDARR